MRDDAVLRRALPLGRGLGRDVGPWLVNFNDHTAETVAKSTTELEAILGLLVTTTLH